MLAGTVSRIWPERPWRTDLLLAFGLYALLAYLGGMVARQPGAIAVLWLANGAATALIVSAAPSRRLALMLSCLAGNLLASLAIGNPLWLAAAFLLPHAAEVALGVELVRRGGQAATFANDHRSFLRLMLRGALLPPLLGATAGAGVLQVLNFAPFDDVWLDWYTGAALGGSAMLPLTVMMRALPLQVSRQRLGGWYSLLALFLVPVATWAALRLTADPFVFLCVLLLLLAFGMPRLVTFAALPLMVSAVAVSLASGWFVPPMANTPTGHAVVYLSALLVVFLVQVVAVMVARQRALDDMLDAVSSRDNEIVTFVDMDGYFRWVSRSRAAFWGTPNAEVLGRVLPELVAAGHVDPRSYCGFLAAKGGATVNEVVSVDFPLRGLRNMEIQCQPARDEEGRQIGVLTSAIDVTERETRQRELAVVAERLQVTNHSLEQFVRIVSHDLREPLNTIVQFSGLIEEGHSQQLNDTGKSYFAQVRSGAERMRIMLDDMLQFVRLEGEALGGAEPVDLDVLLTTVLANLQARIGSSGAQVQVGKLGSVQGHATLLALVLQNLLSNALKFVPAGQAPQVDICARRDKGQLFLTVADQGIGIEQDRLPELGQPFKRLHARRKFEGTGLGLAICVRIAQAHGGRIDLQSTPGQGSRVSLVLPLAPGPQPVSA